MRPITGARREARIAAMVPGLILERTVISRGYDDRYDCPRSWTLEKIREEVRLSMFQKKVG